MLESIDGVMDGGEAEDAVTRINVSTSPKDANWLFVYAEDGTSLSGIPDIDGVDVHTFEDADALTLRTGRPIRYNGEEVGNEQIRPGGGDEAG